MHGYLESVGGTILERGDGDVLEIAAAMTSAEPLPIEPGDAHISPVRLPGLEGFEFHAGRIDLAGHRDRQPGHPRADTLQGRVVVAELELREIEPGHADRFGRGLDTGEPKPAGLPGQRRRSALERPCHLDDFGSCATGGSDAPTSIGSAMRRWVALNLPPSTRPSGT